MKILLVNNFFGPEGGAELSSFLTYQLLRQEGHEVDFFATDKQPYFIPDYEYASYFPDYTDFDALTNPVAKLKALPHFFYNLDAAEKFEAFLLAHRPDVVHCNNLHYHLSPAILKACKKLNIPTVMTMRDVRLMCPAGTLMRGNTTYCKEELCVTGSATNCVTHKCYGGSLVTSVLVTAEFYARRVHKLYDSITTFLAPSQAIADLAVRSGISPDRVTVINNFIDDTFFETQPTYQPGDYFLFVGRLSEEKGVPTLIEAMKSLPTSAELHIVGTGPASEELKTLVQNQGMSNIHFLGFQTGDALRNEYQHCLASVVPSNWFENFSRTVIESVASGKPVIGSKIAGIQEVVEDDVNGYLFPPGDAEALAACMLKLYQDPRKAVEFGRQARQKAERLYNSRVYLDKTIAAYEAAIQKVNEKTPMR